MLAERISLEETAMKGKAMVTNKGFRGFVLPAWIFTLTLFGCIVAGGAADHLCHQRINHQYRDRLD